MTTAAALAPQLSLRGQVLHDTQEWDRLAEPWDEAARRAAFYLSHAWLRAWWSAFGDGRLSLGLVWQGDRLVGLAPWQRRRVLWLGVPTRVVQSLFNPHIVGSDVLVEGQRSRVAEELLGTLDDEPWDVLSLHCVPMASPGVTALREAAMARGLASGTRAPRHAPFIKVQGGWSPFLRGRSARFRKNLRHKRNRMRGSGEELLYACLAAPDEVAAVLPEVMGVALRSWSGRQGSSIASPRERPFYMAAILGLARAGVLRLWTLRLGGQLAAFEIHVRWGRSVSVPKAAYDEDFERLSPGSLLEAHVIENAFRSGDCDRVDLLGLAEPYKLRWTDDSERRVDVLVFNRGVRPWLLEAAELSLRPPLGALKRRLMAR